MSKLPYILLMSVVLFFSCKKEKGNDPLPDVSALPEITGVTLNATSINQFDDLVFDIAYIDGDGDLGTDDADVKSIFITDKRDNTIVHEFHLQPLAPSGQSVAIQGVLKVTLENVILLSQANTSESVQFEVKIKDRASNNSNVITTSNITITK